MGLITSFPSVPPNAPGSGGPFRKWFARKIFNAIGWRFEGELPDSPKIIFAAAPHTSNWDFILVLLARWALGVNFSYLMKREAFIWPFGHFFIAMGGVPVDRKNSLGVVDQMAQWLEKNEKAWLAMTPEGTRSKVDKWKSGFLRVAEKTNVPIFLIGWDYPTKTFFLDGLWSRTGDDEEDLKNLRRYMLNKFSGKHMERQ